ncbi:hypothetical protein ACOME3_007879 [Neoechinorhynchus agilis]
MSLAAKEDIVRCGILSQFLELMSSNLSELCLSPLSICKIALHLAEHTECGVCGFTLLNKDNTQVDDVLPLFHCPFSTRSPMVEVACCAGVSIANERNLKLAGVYFANAVAKDHKVPVHIEELVGKLLAMDDTQSVYNLQVDNEKLAEKPFLVAAIHCQIHDKEGLREGSLRVKNTETTCRIAAQMAASRDCVLLNNIVDFDDYVENVSLDWLNPHVRDRLLVISKNV